MLVFSTNFFRSRYFIYWLLTSFYACSTKTPADVGVYFSLSSARGEKVEVARLPFSGEKKIIVDSGIVINAGSELVFHVPYSPDRLYEIKVAGSLRKFNFIADAPVINITANNANGKYSVQGSAASVSLKDFLDKQEAIYGQLNTLETKTEKSGVTAGDIAGMEKVRDSLQAEANENALTYADTVANAAAFIKVFNTIEFGKNFDTATAVLTRAGRRFGAVQKIKDMLNDAKQLASIYTTEYNIGDTIPSIALPDVADNIFSTASLKGEFYLIDFWATWYPKTLPFNDVKKKAVGNFGTRIKLVSVAMDDDIDAWKQFVISQNLYWTQLVDEKMWQGVAARTLKFDSIPFNFLVNNKGIIIAKAIRPDSLLLILNKLLPKH